MQSSLGSVWVNVVDVKGARCLGLIVFNSKCCFIIFFFCFFGRNGKQPTNSPLCHSITRTDPVFLALYIVTRYYIDVYNMNCLHHVLLILGSTTYYFPFFHHINWHSARSRHACFVVYKYGESHNHNHIQIQSSGQLSWTVESDDTITLCMCPESLQPILCG